MVWRAHGRDFCAKIVSPWLEHALQGLVERPATALIAAHETISLNDMFKPSLTQLLFSTHTRSPSQNDVVQLRQIDGRARLKPREVCLPDAQLVCQGWLHKPAPHVSPSGGEDVLLVGLPFTWN